MNSTFRPIFAIAVVLLGAAATIVATAAAPPSAAAEASPPPATGPAARPIVGVLVQKVDATVSGRIQTVADGAIVVATGAKNGDEQRVALADVVEIKFFAGLPPASATNPSTRPAAPPPSTPIAPRPATRPARPPRGRPATDTEVRTPAPATLPATPASTAPSTKPATQPWTFVIVGGDRLTGTPANWDDKSVQVRSATVGTLRLPVRQLVEVWHGTAESIEKARALNEPVGLDDVAYVEAEGGQVRAVRGLVRGADGDSLKFRYNEQDRQIAQNRLVGVAFGTADRAAPSDELRQAFHLNDGDVISGTWTSFSGTSIELRTDWDATVNVPTDLLKRLQTRNGRLVLLADLAPAQAELVPYFDRIPAWRANVSLAGGTLKTSEGDQPNGLAVHARTVLHFDVAGKFQRLKGKVGFQLPEGKLGRAVARISGDGKTLFERTNLRGEDPPASFDLDVAGVKRLSLEVDFGDAQDVGDDVVWVNPRLIRAN